MGHMVSNFRDFDVRKNKLLVNSWRQHISADIPGEASTSGVGAPNMVTVASRNSWAMWALLCGGPN